VRVCVVTSLGAHEEPRAPRHALAAKEAFPHAEVILIDMAPMGEAGNGRLTVWLPGIIRQTIEYPWRRKGAVRLILRKLRVHFARRRFSVTGVISADLFAERTIGLGRALKKMAADLYFAHNIETLVPAMQAAQATGGRVLFDCMEFYSDMGADQTDLEKRATSKLEAKLLPCCALVTASSEALADALEATYDIKRPLSLYNTPPAQRQLPSKRGGGLNLYWRNSTIAFGQRGLEDALIALTELPEEVSLFLQGRCSLEMRVRLEARAESLGVYGRVTLLPPYLPGRAVTEAAPHDIGLCLERAGPRNHELTVSNKMFDYHMAGLAIVSSNMPSLARVIARSRGGLTYSAGSPRDLAKKILFLYEHPLELKRLARNAREFALNVANMESDVARLRSALSELVPPDSGANK
jgi:glycogen(starch) synthase